MREIGIADAVRGKKVMSGGAGYTHYTCPDHVYDFPPRPDWDELPALRWHSRH